MTILSVLLPENSQCAAGTDDSNPGPEVRVGPQNRPKNPHHARSKQEYKTKGAKTKMPQCQKMGIVASAKHHITPKVARFEVQSANRSSRAGKRLANTGSLLIQLCPPIGPSLPQVGGTPQNILNIDLRALLEKPTCPTSLPAPNHALKKNTNLHAMQCAQFKPPVPSQLAERRTQLGICQETRNRGLKKRWQ